MGLNNIRLLWLLAAAMTALAFVSYYWSLLDVASPFFLGDDAAQYVLLSRAMVDGHGYHSVWIDGMPPHLKFPFGLPALFVCASFFSPAWLFLYLVPVIAAGAAVLMVFLFMRDREAPIMAWGISVLVGISPLVCLYARSLLSEIPFMFFLMSALFLADRCIRRDQISVLESAALIFFMLGAVFIRTAGFVLPLAFMAILLAGRRWCVAGLSVRLKVVALAVLLPLAMWMGASLLGDSSSGESYWFLLAKYVDPVKGVVDNGSLAGAALTVVKGFYAIFIYAIPSVLTAGLASGFSAVSIMISLAVVVGWWMAWRKYRGVAEIFIVLYLAGLSVWPWVQSSGVRMVLPVLPLLYYYLFQSIKAVQSRWVPEKWPLLLPGIVLCVLVGLNIRSGVSPVSKGPGDGSVAGVCDAYAWIRHNTPENALFLSPVPASLYLYGGRKSLAGPALYGLSEREIAALFDTRAIDYVYDPAAVIWKRDALTAVRSRLELVYEAGGQRVYRVRQ